MEKTDPSPHFHPLMRPSQGHGDSRDQKPAPYPDTGPESGGEGRPAHPCHNESLWAVPPQPTVLVRSQFANAQDKLRSNLNSYSTTIPPSGACLFDSTCPGYGNGWPVVVSTSRKCSAGLVPRWGRGGAWQNPPCQFAVPNHDSGFSYLGVPAPAGMSDCYESMSRTPIRDRLLRQPLIRHSRHPFVNPAPQSSFRRSKACPVP